MRVIANGVAFEELPVHTMFQYQRASHEMTSPKMTRLILLKKPASTHLRPGSQIMLSLQRSLSGLISLPTSALRFYLTSL